MNKPAGIAPGGLCAIRRRQVSGLQAYSIIERRILLRSAAAFSLPSSPLSPPLSRGCGRRLILRTFIGDTNLKPVVFYL
jgi:hypothetical protein